MISGLYMNTPLVYGLIHKTEEEADVSEEAEVEEEVAVEDEASTEVESTTDVTESTDDTEVVDGGEDKPKVKKFRPKLTQYITNAFKEITTREPRFHGLLLGKEVTALVNNLIYQVMDRYVNVIKSLLRVGNSKTITDHLAVIATVILLRDDIHTTDEDVQVIVDLLQERVEALKVAKALKSETGETESVQDESVQDETVEETVVEEPTPKGKGRVKKSA
jgi:chorismate mutase